MSSSSSSTVCPIYNVLWLTMDISGSISDLNLYHQIQGYKSALTEVIPTFYGEIAIGVSAFGTNVVPVVALMPVMNAADLTTVTDAIISLGSATRGGVSTGATSIGDATKDATDNIVSSPYWKENCANMVIDVSTDGNNNHGADPETMAEYAQAHDIRVNCLGITDLANCHFVESTGGKNFTATSFTEVDAALKTKLAYEVRPITPAPSLATTALPGTIAPTVAPTPIPTLISSSSGSSSGSSSSESPPPPSLSSSQAVVNTTTTTPLLNTTAAPTSTLVPTTTVAPDCPQLWVGFNCDTCPFKFENPGSDTCESEVCAYGFEGAPECYCSRHVVAVISVSTATTAKVTSYLEALGDGTEESTTTTTTSSSSPLTAAAVAQAVQDDVLAFISSRCGNGMNLVNATVFEVDGSSTNTSSSSAAAAEVSSLNFTLDINPYEVVSDDATCNATVTMAQCIEDAIEPNCFPLESLATVIDGPVNLTCAVDNLTTVVSGPCGVRGCGATGGLMSGAASEDDGNLLPLIIGIVAGVLLLLLAALVVRRLTYGKKSSIQNYDGTKWTRNFHDRDMIKEDDLAIDLNLEQFIQDQTVLAVPQSIEMVGAGGGAVVQGVTAPPVIPGRDPNVQTGISDSLLMDGTVRLVSAGETTAIIEAADIDGDDLDLDLDLGEAAVTEELDELELDLEEAGGGGGDDDEDPFAGI